MQITFFMNFLYYFIFFISAICVEMFLLPILIKIPLIPLTILLRKVDNRLKSNKLYHSFFYWFKWEYFIEGISAGFLLIYLIFLFNQISEFHISSIAVIILIIILIVKNILSWKKVNPINLELSLWGSQIFGYISGLLYFHFF